MNRLLRSRVRLQHMQLLVLIDETRNLHEVADRLALTQPAVTKSLQELERLLGVPLFVRTPQGLRHTAHTRVATRMAREIITSVEHAHAAFREIEQSRDSRIIVGGIHSSVAGVIPAALAELQAIRPDVVVTVVPGTTRELVPALVAGQVHLVVGVIDEESVHPSVSAVCAGADRFVLVGGPRHPMAQQPTVALDDALRQPWIACGQPRDIVPRLAQLRTERAVVPHEPDLEMDTWATTLPKLLSDRCLTTVSRQMARSLIGMGLASLVRAELPFPAFEIGVMCLRDRPLTEPLEQARELLLAGVRRAWPRDNARDAGVQGPDLGSLFALA